MDELSPVERIRAKAIKEASAIGSQIGVDELTPFPEGFHYDPEYNFLGVAVSLVSADVGSWTCHDDECPDLFRDKPQCSLLDRCQAEVIRPLVVVFEVLKDSNDPHSFTLGGHDSFCWSDFVDEHPKENRIMPEEIPKLKLSDVSAMYF